MWPKETGGCLPSVLCVEGAVGSYCAMGKQSERKLNTLVAEWGEVRKKCESPPYSHTT